MPTLPCKLPHAKHEKCNAFFSVDCGWLWKEPVLWSVGSEKNRLFTADVQNDAPSPSHMHAVVPSIDQRPCDVDDALRNASRTRIDDSLLQVADVANRVVLYACTFLRFVQPLLGNSHINYRALYPFNWYKLLIKTLSSALITIFTQRSRDAVTVMWKTRQYHFHHFTSEQNEVSKNEVIWQSYTCSRFLNVCWWHLPKIIKIGGCVLKLWPVKPGTFFDSQCNE